MSRQRTIEKPVEVSGLGLFTGLPVRLRFLPAQANTGVVFVRTDQGQPVRIVATIASLAGPQDRRTCLKEGSLSVDTTEHVLSAVSGLGIDNLAIELDGPEIPGNDCSSRPFAEALMQAGLVEQEAEKKVFVIETPTAVSDNGAMLAALPGEGDYLDILYDLDYGPLKSIGRQVLGFRLHADDYLAQIAPARTFLLEAEAAAFRARGWGSHLSPNDLLIMGENGPLDNQQRFPDEQVRHKVSDLIGDLSLLGRGLRGRIVAYRSGHGLNHQLVRKLTEQMTARDRAKGLTRQPQLDIRQIMLLLPHRYPFLMIDRVIELVNDEKAVGIKNVSINEPYFQGHYPGEPIMPGVLILEAMAQLSGILLSQRLEHTGKVAFLVSLDNAKHRRPVRPGDQMVVEAYALHVRSRTGHCRCLAYVGGELVAEAELKFMLVDKESV